MIGPRCTRDTFCQTIAKTSASDLSDKCKFCQNGQIFKGADGLDCTKKQHAKFFRDWRQNMFVCRGEVVEGW